MRILHFMNLPIPLEEMKSGGNGLVTSGGWMAALVTAMLRGTDDAIACAAFGKVREVHTAHDERLDSFILPGELLGGDLDRFLGNCSQIVREWRPDLLHIHGTEAAYGLLTARHLVECPVVISLQGLLGPYAQWHSYFGNSRLSDLVRMHRLPEILALRGEYLGYWRYRAMAKREREIILGNRFFMGRTAWDRAYLRSLNPSASYFQGRELLRGAFWQQRWDLGRARRYRIIFTNAGHPRKGAESLIEAVRLLKRDYPSIQLAIAGGISRRSGYGRYLRRCLSSLGESATELGQLDAESMVQELLQSHVFVSPSFIDNSPNAVCEAQLLGMPVVATYTGGLPSLIEDGVTGLFYPPGDAPMLAAKLRALFQDYARAAELGTQARLVARKRHAPDDVVKEVAAAYRQIITGAT